MIFRNTTGARGALRALIGTLDLGALENASIAVDMRGGALVVQVLSTGRGSDEIARLVPTFTLEVTEVPDDASSLTAPE